MLSSDYAVIDSAGMIVRTGECSLESLEHQAGPGEILIVEPGDISDDTHFWDFMTQGWREYPPSPGPWAAFDFSARHWIDPRTDADRQAALDAQRAASIAAVNAATERWRSARATAIWGQDALYQIKEAAGIALLSGVPLTAIQQAALMQEVGITAATIEGVAEVYVGMGEALRSALVTFESLRMPTILQIETASDTDGVRAAEAWFLANLPN